MLKNYFSMLKTEFKGYNGQRLVKDLMAGLTVAAVALPLALAFGVSSGADAAAGLITAIIAGVVISILSGASYQISGPTGAMSAILITIVAKYKMQGVFIVCFIAGVIILLCGIFKLGKLISLIPRPVITGFTSGIAIIIALGQIDNFFGTVSKGETAIEKLLSYGELGFNPNFQAIIIGMIVVVIMLVFPKKWNAKVPSSLVGIIVAAIVSTLLNFDVAQVGQIPQTLFPEARFDIFNVDWSQVTNFISPAITVAALGMIESLLCGASASNMKNEPFNADQELIAQGVGNIMIPFFGGVPATAAIARTSVAIKSGGQTRLTGVFHALGLLACMFLLSPIMSKLPLSALAGVLMVTAWRMNEWENIKYYFEKKFKGAIAKFFITMVATVIFDLTVAIVIGVVFSLLIFVSKASNLTISVSKVANDKMKHSDKDVENDHKNSYVIYTYGYIFFCSVEKLAKKMNEIAKDSDEIILSLRGISGIDTTGVSVMSDTIVKLKNNGVSISLCGVNDNVKEVLDRSGLSKEIGEENFYWSVDKALI